MIKNFSKQNIQELRKEITEALEEIAKKHNINIAAGNASFTASTLTMKLEMAVMSSNGEPASKEAEAFKRYAPMLGLQASDLGREFTFRGKQFVLLGYNPKSKKYGFIAKNTVDGKIYKLTDDGVKAALK